jgi:hypothetical protein
MTPEMRDRLAQLVGKQPRDVTQADLIREAVRLYEAPTLQLSAGSDGHALHPARGVTAGEGSRTGTAVDGIKCCEGRSTCGRTTKNDFHLQSCVCGCLPHFILYCYCLLRHQHSHQTKHIPV